MASALSSSTRGGVAHLRMERPDLHNAFDAGLIAELTAALATAGDDAAVRVVVLSGAGASFSAGADLNWMRDMAAAGEAENREDALALARLMRTLDELPKPTIARVHGAAFGGGVGLVACCDIAIGLAGAKFGLTESRLGLLPAVISPYVIAAIGPRQARRWFATAEIFDAAEAHRLGLLHEVAADIDALQAMRITYGHVDGAEAFFEYIAEKHPGPTLPQLFNTHPGHLERITRIREFAQKHPSTVRSEPILLPSFMKAPEKSLAADS